MDNEQLKLLIVDDEIAYLDSLRDILEYQGKYNVEVAYNGEDAIKKASAFLPDLIVCDVGMPNMDGYQILEELKKNETTINIPFIFLTGRADKKDQRKGMNLGADDYLTKPFTAQEILAAIKARLKKHRKETKVYEGKIHNIKKVVSTTLPHELRSPLSTIMGFTQLIRTRFDSFTKEEILVMLNDVENSGKRLLRLISNYIFYNRLVNNPETFFDQNPVPVIYSSMVLDTIPYEIASKYERINDLTIRISNANIIISNECFNKLVEELTENAFKFSKKGDSVEVLTDIEDNHYKISFVDEGIEMTKDDFMKIGIFEQFQRDSLEQQGSGMGLAIVSQIIELFKGRLEFIAEPGGRTTFNVFIPLANDQFEQTNI